MTSIDSTSALHWFRDAIPYIQKHRGKIMVIQFSGGLLLGDQADALIHDIALLHSLGVQCVLVPGAREHINARVSADTKLAADKRRVTDTDTVQTVKDAVGNLRIELEMRLSQSLKNTPLSGVQLRAISGNFVTAKPLGVIDGVDYQLTGDVRRIDSDGIREQLAQHHIVILPPMGYAPTGECFNLTAEDVAVSAASALTADKLIFLSDTNNDLPDHLSLEQAQAFKNDSSQSAELRMHLQSAIDASLNGVKRIHILNQSQDGALFSELYTRDGSGTLVTAGVYESVRQATIDDVPGIYALIQPKIKAGQLLPRSIEQLEHDIQQFSVIERDGVIIGCAALKRLDQDNCELACLAVNDYFNNNGHGKTMLEHIACRAYKEKFKTMYALSTQSEHWFLENGFVKSSPDNLPKSRVYDRKRSAEVFARRINQYEQT